MPLPQNGTLTGVGGAPADARLPPTAGWVVSGGHGDDSRPCLHRPAVAGYVLAELVTGLPAELLG